MDDDSIFLEALQKPSPIERADFVTQACAGNEALRHDVERLLDAHERAGQFLLGNPRPATVDAPEREGAGALIGPYKLLEQIGEGGFGMIFMAEQQQPVRRRVALKVLKPGLDTRQVIARFEAERQALALMDHPNIARVFDGGETANGRPYFVMELVKGLPITDYCEQADLTLRQRLELFVHVSQAVQHAHQKGIIHRDIKPSNVLVTLHDGAPVVKVIDFGIAKATGQQLTDKTLFTNFDELIGTPLYMSPEQAALSGLDVDTRSDIYSLGVLLYELLTGTTPLEKERLKKAGFDEMRRIIREEEPPKPSTRISTLGQAATTTSTRRKSDPKQLSHICRGELDWIVMKCLEKDRERRYETANGLARDIERYLHDEPVQARPPSVSYRLRKFVRRHRVGLGTSAVVTLVLLLSASGVGWLSWRQSAQNRARRAETERAVTSALGRTEQLRDQASALPTATSLQADAALVIWRQAADTLAQGEAAMSTGATDDILRQHVVAMRRQVEAGRLQTEQIRARLKRKEQVFRDLDEARMASVVWVDNRFDYVGAVAKYAAAFAAYDPAMATENLGQELTRRLSAQEPELREALIVALDDWGANADSAKMVTLAIQLHTLAEAVDDDPWRRRCREAAHAKDSAALRGLSAEARQSSVSSSSLVRLAGSLMRLGERNEAMALLRFTRGRHPTDFWVHFTLGLCFGEDATAVERAEEIGCHRAALALRPRASAVHNNLGVALERNEQWDEAVAEYTRAITLDPKHAPAHAGLSNVLRKMGRLDEAIAAAREAIRLKNDLAGAHNSLGTALWEKRCLDEAISAFREAIRLNKDSPYAHNNLGNALWEKRRLNEAIAECEEAIRLKPNYAQAHCNLGNALSDKGQKEKAIAEYRKAIDLDPMYAQAHFNLGLALMSDNQPDEAITEFRMALELDPTDARAHFNLGRLLASKNVWDDAIIEYREAIRHRKNYPEAYNDLGAALKANGRLDEAIAAFREAISLRNDLFQAHSNLGIVLAEQGDVEGAIAEFREAIRLMPGVSALHKNLATALYRKGDLDAAIAAYREAIRLKMDDHVAHRRLADTLRAKGLRVEAITEYRVAIRIKTDDALAYGSLGETLRDEGKPDEAVAAFQEAVRLDGQSSMAWQMLGWTQYQAQNWQASIESLEKSCKLENGTGDCGQWIVLALAHGQLARQESLPEQERALHQTEAHRRYAAAIKQIDAWPPGINNSVRQGIRAFRAEAKKLLDESPEKN